MLNFSTQFRDNATSMTIRRFLLLFCLGLFASAAAAQQADKWLGLKINETTPEQAIAILGRPTTDSNAGFATIWIDRLLTRNIEKPIFRVLKYGPRNDPDMGTQAGFLDGKLVYLNVTPGDLLGRDLAKAMPEKWREAGDDPAADFENWDKPKATIPTAGSQQGMMGTTLLALSDAYFGIAMVVPTLQEAQAGKFEVIEGKPLPGRVAMLTLVSRTLVRKPDEPDADDGPIPAINEVVMAPGSSITAETKTGQITIKAGKGVMRSYTWEGATRVVDMWPRKQRWQNGSLGIYFPGPGDHWKEHNGITRLVGEEARLNFPSAAAAQAWLKTLSSAGTTVYRNDGLVVTFDKNLSRKQLNVDVWQIMINGRKPTNLAGADDSKIR